MFISTLITSLAAPKGNMKRILCSDWLPERARWAHLARSGLPALIPRMKKIELELQFRRWIRKKWPKIVKTKETETTLLRLFCQKQSWLSFEVNKSFIILIKAKSFCDIINPLLTKHDQDS